eukprot:scaffold11431_cov118-Isochrysis_galbana.AAC.8
MPPGTSAATHGPCGVAYAKDLYRATPSASHSLGWRVVPVEDDPLAERSARRRREQSACGPVSREGAKEHGLRLDAFQLGWLGVGQQDHTAIEQSLGAHVLDEAGHHAARARGLAEVHLQAGRRGVVVGVGGVQVG